MLQIGDPIPEFALASTEGDEVSSMSLRGKRYVLYFYPKDDTPGCTTEACNFRDNLPHFNEIATPVYGVSPDDLTAHQKFIAKHALNFPLLADPDHKLIEAVGVWVEKSMYGKKYMGVQRSTFVVGPDGRIEKVWPKVTPDGHAQEVLEYLKSISPTRNTPAGNLPASRAASQITPHKRSTAKATDNKKASASTAKQSGRTSKATRSKPGAKKATSQKSTTRKATGK